MTDISEYKLASRTKPGRRIGIPATRILRKMPGLLATSVLLLFGSLYALSGLIAIINFAWPHPMFDQYRLYTYYLGLPFPENVLQLENGHRPIVPALIRLAEIQWFSANQILQITFGTTCAFLTAAIVAITVWRERDVSMPIRAACFASAWISVFWLANARMLLHGNELVHAYLLTLCVVLGALAVYRASRGSSQAWMFAATMTCIVATFCFGPGIATFPALVVLAWLSRVPLRSLWSLPAGFAICIIVYLWALPGDGGVRGMLHLRPLESIAMAARWIASPWITAWLGFAEPSSYPWITDKSDSSSIISALKYSADTSQALLHLDWRFGGAMLIGLSGFGILAIALLRRLGRRSALGLSESLALTLAMFGAATSLVIGIGRLDYLIELPGQVFADRYLVWPCLFWLGCGMLLLLKFDRIGRPARAVAIIVAVIVPIALLPTHESGVGWGALVYRNGQIAAIAARSDVIDGNRFYDDAAASRGDRLLTLRLLKERRLAMYAAPETEWLGRSVSLTAADPRVEIQFARVDAVNDVRDGSLAAHFDGTIATGLNVVRDGGALAVVDSHDRVTGFVVRSFLGSHKSSLRLNLPKKRGFDGYIRHYSPTETYRLVLLDPTAGIARPIARIPALSP
jgi:hypothetical protein